MTDGRGAICTPPTYHWSDLVELAPRYIKPGMRVLELGCGDGRNAALFLHMGANYFGIDKDIKYLDNWSSGTFILGDYSDCDWPENIDVIIDRSSVCYNRDVRPIFERIAGGLNAGGVYICVDWLCEHADVKAGFAFPLTEYPRGLELEHLVKKTIENEYWTNKLINFVMRKPYGNCSE